MAIVHKTLTVDFTNLTEKDKANVRDFIFTYLANADNDELFALTGAIGETLARRKKMSVQDLFIIMSLMAYERSEIND